MGSIHESKKEFKKEKKRKRLHHYYLVYSHQLLYVCACVMCVWIRTKIKKPFCTSIRPFRRAFFALIWELIRRRRLLKYRDWMPTIQQQQQQPQPFHHDNWLMTYWDTCLSVLWTKTVLFSTFPLAIQLLCLLLPLSSTADLTWNAFRELGIRRFDQLFSF